MGIVRSLREATDSIAPPVPTPVFRGKCAEALEFRGFKRFLLIAWARRVRKLLNLGEIGETHAEKSAQAFLLKGHKEERGRRIEVRTWAVVYPEATIPERHGKSRRNWVRLNIVLSTRLVCPAEKSASRDSGGAQFFAVEIASGARSPTS